MFPHIAFNSNLWSDLRFCDTVKGDKFLPSHCQCESAVIFKIVAYIIVFRP